MQPPRVCLEFTVMPWHPSHLFIGFTEDPNPKFVHTINSLQSTPPSSISREKTVHRSCTQRGLLATWSPCTYHPPRKTCKTTSIIHPWDQQNIKKTIKKILIKKNPFEKNKLFKKTCNKLYEANKCGFSSTRFGNLLTYLETNSPLQCM